MKGIILHDHEVRQLAQAGKVLVVRPMFMQTSFITTGFSYDPRGFWYNQHCTGYEIDEAAKNGGSFIESCSKGRVSVKGAKCPFDPVGTQFYVKEAWRTMNDPAQCIGDSLVIDYRSDGKRRLGDIMGKFKWKSAVSMLKWASRFTVETVSVECRRVQEITNEQVEDLSGIGFHMPKCGFYGTRRLGYNHVLNSAGESVDGEPICKCGDYGWDEIFGASWDIRNPKHPWSSNPWCWYATLKRV